MTYISKHNVYINDFERLDGVLTDKRLWKETDNMFYISAHLVVDDMEISIFSRRENLDDLHRFKITGYDEPK